MRNLRRYASVPLALSGALLVIWAASARADMFGGDLPLLSALVTNTSHQLDAMAESLAVLRESYDETKRLAGYAREAKEAFGDFRREGAGYFGDEVKGYVEERFPDVAYFRNEANRTGPWAQSTGELSSLVRMCVRDGLGKESCAQAQEALSLGATRRALKETFGAPPPADKASAILQDEAAVAVAQSSAQFGRSALQKAQAEALLESCVGPKAHAEKCAAAGNAADVLALKSQAEATELLAENNHLTALGLAEQAAARTQAWEEAQARQKSRVEGAKRMTPDATSIRSEGLDVFAGEPR